MSNVLKTKQCYIFGDSIAKSIECQNNRLKKSDANVVDKINENFNINLINFSQIGQTLNRINDKNLIPTFIENYTNKNEKQYVILECCGNDCDFDWNKVEQNDKNNCLNQCEPKTPLNQFENLLLKNIKSLKQNNFEPILVLTPPIDEEKYFEKITQSNSKDAILKFFNNDISNIYRFQECYNFSVLKTAYKNKCKVIDLRSEFLLKLDYKKYLSEDGIHPNSLGYNFIYDILCKNLNKYISKKNDNETSKINLNETSKINMNEILNQF